MEKNIEKYVFVKQNFLDKEFCQNTIEKINQFNIWKKHDWNKYKPDQEQEHVMNSTSPSGKNEPEVIHPEDIMVVNETSLNDINGFILSEVMKVLNEYVDSFDFEWFRRPFHLLTNLKFIKYTLNQTMKVHCDHIHSMFDGKIKGIPIISIIGILNDDYEGGNLIMFGDKKINTNEGDLIIFPSLFLFPHKIEPVTKGIRYSYVSWVC